MRMFNFNLTILFILLGNGVLLAQPIASFTADKYKGCAGQFQVNFTNTSTGATSYTWDLGDGDFSNDVNPSKIFIASGTKIIRLIATDGGLSDTATAVIQSFRSPIAQFTLSSDTICVNSNICVTSNNTLGDAPLMNCLWDFGIPPVLNNCNDTCFSYKNPGTYNITRVLVDTNGCQGILSNVKITVRQPPVAKFSVSQNNSCVAPLCVQFTNNSSHPQGFPIGFVWNFGDGTSSTATSPAQKCYPPGTYNIVLRVNDSKGCYSIDSNRINVSKLVANFTLSNNNVCNGDSFCLTNTSIAQGVGSTVTYSWNFGGNVTSNDTNPCYVYNTNGSRRILLKVSMNGCTDTISKPINITDPIAINFTGSPLQKCVPPLTVNFTGSAPGASSVQYNWGDNNNTCPTLNCSYTYTRTGCYDVTLNATAPSGCVSKLVKKNYVCIQPFDAIINTDSTAGCAPLKVTFSNGTPVGGSPIVDCKWSMGNGTIYSTDCNNPFTYTFQNPGTYNVWLRVQTADGCYDTAYTTISVTSPPTANFIANPLQACLKTPIQFTCQCSGGTSYQWNFGPGTSTQQNPNYTYDQPGPHTVTLIVKNGRCATTVTKTQYVTSNDPKADFTYKTSCGNPLNVDFTSTSIGADSLWWRMDNGMPTTPRDTAKKKNYVYPVMGSYNVTLYAYNIATGCTDSITKKVNLLSQSKTFGADKLVVCAGDAITFTDSTNFGTKWNWYFGDGDSSSVRNPIKKYKAAGKYTVKLVINKGLPCNDSIIRISYITVNKPKANFVADKTSGCSPLTVNFTSTSTGNYAPIVAWNWRFAASGRYGSNVNSTDGDTTWVFTGTNTFNDVRLIVTDSLGCKDTLMKYKYIDETVIKPDFNFSGFQCAGNELTFRNLTQSPASYTYIWDFGDGDTLHSSTSANVFHTYAQTDSYYVTLTAKAKTGNCSTIIAKKIVIESIGLDFFNTSITVACPPYATQFINTTADTGIVFTWYFGDRTPVSHEESPYHIYKFPGDYDVSLVGQKGNCRDSLVKKKLVSILGPRLDNVQIAPPYGCRPLTIFFSGKVYETQKADIQWRVGDVQTMPIVYGDTVYFNEPHTYTDPQYDTGYVRPVLLLEDNKGCKVTYPLADSLYVDEYPYPNLRDTSVCIGAVVEYNLNDGDFFRWEPSDYLTCDTCSFVVSNAPDTISYIVTATTKWGCEAKDTVTLNVEDLPKLNIIPEYIRLCYGETTVLCAGDVYNALWSPPINISSPTDICPTLTAMDTITWIVYSENRLGHQPGCYLYDTVTVYPIDTVKVDFIQDIAICSGESTQLNITVQQASYNDTAFFWYPTTYLDNPNQQNPIATPPYTMDFTVIIKSPLCVPDSHTFNVRVDPLPDIDLYRDTAVAVSSEVELAALSLDAIQYNWSSTDPLSCSDCASPILTANYTQWIYVTVTNQFGCQSTDSVYIKVLPCTPDFVFVPTVFTPNGDGLNDKLYVRGKALKKLTTFIVTNRWGNVVFSTNNIKDGWDGTYRGQMSPTDAYVWYVKGICTNDQEVEKRGTITLVR